MAADGDNLLAHLDMDKSWLSDHPLVSTMVHIPVDPVGQLRIAAATVPKTHFKVKMGAFNVLSKFASQVGTNAPHVSLEKDSLKPLNQTVYLKIFDILIGDAPNLLTTRKQKQDYFTRTKSNNVRDFDALVNQVVEIIEQNSDLKEKSIASMDEFLLKNRSVFINNPDGTHTKIEQLEFNDLKEKISTVLQLGGKSEPFPEKPGSKKLILTTSRESVHKSLIDNVLNSQNMGGFAFTVDGDLTISEKGYNQSKSEFLKKVIDNFFRDEEAATSNSPDVSICVCPEYDYDENCDATLKDAESSNVNLLKASKPSLFLGGFRKLGKITTDNNFCRKVFIQVHQPGILCSVKQTKEDMYYFDKKKDPQDYYLRKKDTVDKLTITLTEIDTKKVRKFVLFSVHLDSTTMSSYKTVGDEVRYKKLMETYQLLSIISQQIKNDDGIPIFVVGDFNCDFKDLDSKGYQYLNSFDSDFLKELDSAPAKIKIAVEKIKADKQVESQILTRGKSQAKIKFTPAIPIDNNGTPKNRVFGFYNAQAEKGDELRIYNTDNIVLVNQREPEISFSNQNLTVKTNLENNGIEYDPPILYPLFVEKILSQEQQMKQKLEEEKAKERELIDAKKVEQARKIFEQAGEAQTRQEGGSRKRNRKRNKKSLKKRNKRKSSRKKSKNPRKKRSKRR